MHIHFRFLGPAALKGLLDHLKPRGCQGMILLLFSLVRVLNLLGSPYPACRGGVSERGVEREVCRSHVGIV